MKKRIAHLFLLCLVIPTLVFANHSDPQGKYTKEKRIKKEYKVNADAKLLIDNSYGNINIVSWNQNRVVIEVLVKTNGKDEGEVQKKLDEIDIQFEGSTDYISAKTLFEKTSNRSWWNSWNTTNVHMEINYTIKLPATNAIDISNDYGSINLDRLEGTARINCDYGKITVGELLADNNYLNFDYTKNSTIGYMKSGIIKADYSSFLLERGGDIELKADYSTSEFGVINKLDYNCDYGSIITSESTDIVGRGDYLSVKIGIVHGGLNLDADYGSIRVEELASDAGDVSIQSDYTGIKIGYHQGYNFTFNIQLEYAGLSGKEDLTLNKERIDSSDKYYEGYRGDNTSGNNLNINSEYGGVTLSKNH